MTAIGDLSRVLWRYRRGRQRLRGAVFGTFVFRACGEALRVEGPVHMRYPRADIQVGSHVFVGPRVTFDVPPGGKIRLGDRVNLTQDIVLSASASITIGNDVMIAEFVSIRDSAHGKAAGTPINAQPSSAQDIVIGSDVWIGRGAIIMPGVTVGDGAVIGANSVVNRNVDAFTVVAGTPARVISHRR